MNCISFRKFAGAFADGELDVRQNLEALEHINMCPICAGRVEEVSRQRSALVRLWGEQSAPPRVQREVRGALQREYGVAVQHGAVEEFDAEVEFALPVTGRRFRRRGSLVLVGMTAACLAVAGFWPGGGSPRTAAAQFVDAVRDHHLDCPLWRGGDFLDISHVREFQAEARMKYDLTLAVPTVNVFGYRLRSMCHCDLKGVRGIHQTFVIPESGERISVFTTPPQTGLVTALKDNLTSRRYYVSPDNESPAVIAWHDEKRTITVCAGMAPGALVNMFDQVVVAAHRQLSADSVLLASTGF